MLKSPWLAVERLHSQHALQRESVVDSFLVMPHLAFNRKFDFMIISRFSTKYSCDCNQHTKRLTEHVFAYFACINSTSLEEREGNRGKKNMTLRVLLSCTTTTL